MSGLFVFQSPFRFQVWPKTKTLQIVPDSFASTYPLMVSSTSPREAFLACPLSPPWNLPFFTADSTLSSPCPGYDPPLSRPRSSLAHLGSLPPYNLVLWTDGSVPFPLGKGDSGILANCSLRDTEATLSLWASPIC